MSLGASGSRRLRSDALGYERSFPVAEMMVPKLRHDYFVTASELVAAKRAESYADFYRLDCLPFILKIMVHLKVFLCRNLVQVEINIGAIFFKPSFCEGARKAIMNQNLNLLEPS